MQKKGWCQVTGREKGGVTGGGGGANWDVGKSTGPMETTPLLVCWTKETFSPPLLNLGECLMSWKEKKIFLKENF